MNIHISEQSSVFISQPQEGASEQPVDAQLNFIHQDDKQLQLLT